MAAGLGLPSGSAVAATTSAIASSGLAAGSSNSGGLSAPTNPDAPVLNLGKVGRGSKRITLQPMQAAGSTANAGPAGARPAAPKRNLEDLMGGAGGITMVGFGGRGIGGIGGGLGSGIGGGFGSRGALPEAVEIGKLRLAPVGDQLAKRLKVDAPSCKTDGAQGQAAAGVTDQEQQQPQGHEQVPQQEQEQAAADEAVME